MNDTSYIHSSSIKFSLKPSIADHSRPWRRSALWRTAMMGIALYFSRAPPPPLTKVYTNSHFSNKNYACGVRSGSVAFTFTEIFHRRRFKEPIKIPVFPCKLFQRVQLNKELTIIPASIGDGVVELKITSCNGDRLLRAERFLQMLDEAWAQEENQTLSDKPAFGHQGGDSDEESLN